MSGSGKLDQSLDEILTTKRNTAPRRQSNRKTTRPAPAAPVGGIQKHRKSIGNNAAKPAPGRGAKVTGVSKIIVSNLPKDVSESQIKEYFQKAVGGVKKAELSYGPGGASRGIANIIFHQADGARKAFQKLNGMLVDNKPIRVEVVLAGDQVPEPPTLSQRITQPKAQPKSAATDKTSAKGAKAAANGGKAPAKKGRVNPKSSRPAKKTADELDAEMADYFDSAKANEASGAAVNGDAQMEDEIM